MNIGDQLTERVKKHTQSQVVIEEEEYAYSDNGHMTSRVLTIGGNDYTTSYQYDVGGNLKQVTLPDSATVTYQYDAYGNRVKKQTASEKVSYEYAGGSCQREIHRNPSDTILYTLRYYPWGFTKTVPGTPDVTTAYYYLVDMRGWVWGLTDSDGIILETYQYSPYGELLSTPTITHSRFLSGADECLWDSETGLYYLHARYYDPQLGRFIQEDIVEGDLESPASQNRYTYCQNDPVSLIDPSGYSPQNTNTPSRFGQFNIANLDSPYGCSLSDLQPVLPELQPSSGGEVIGPESQYYNNQGLKAYQKRGYETSSVKDGPMMGSYDGCNPLTNEPFSVGSDGGPPKWQLKNKHGQIIAEDKGDGNGPVFYEIDEDGNLLDKDCKKIDSNDKDYESKRVVTKDIYGTMYKIKILALITRSNAKKYELITGEAWDSNGNPINVIVGFKYTDGIWYGFSIDTEGMVLGFYEDEYRHPLNRIDAEFKKKGIDITPGSFFTAKAENLRKKNKGGGNYDFWMDLTVTLYLSFGYGKKKKLIYFPSIIINNLKHFGYIFWGPKYTDIK